MVSITRRTPLQRTIDRLKGAGEVTIIACNSCAHYCGTGGRLAMDHLTFHLQETGIEVSGKELVTKVCIQEQLLKCSVKGTLVLMACSSGLASARELWPEANIIQVNDTLGLGSYDPDIGAAILLLPFQGHESLVGMRFPNTTMEELP